MTGVPEPALEVVEYTDPLCPWAWGSEPVFRALAAALAGRVRRRRVYAVLFDHDDDPPPDPAAETAWYARHVAEISTHTRAPHAVTLSRVAASSWPASLVAKAAELQGAEVAEPAEEPVEAPVERPVEQAAPEPEPARPEPAPDPRWTRMERRLPALLRSGYPLPAGPTRFLAYHHPTDCAGYHWRRPPAHRPSDAGHSHTHH